MIQKSQIVKIAFVGFSPLEKAPFSSIFALSKCRPISYEEKSEQGQADVYLVNSENEAAMAAVQKVPDSASRIMLIGDAVPEETRWKRMSKPVRWIRLFDMLDGFVALQNPNAVAATTPSQNAGKVLVVDDNETVRKFMAQKLNPFQFHVDFAESGEEALRFARDNTYVCVFLDVVMAGIDGYQVCRLLKQSSTCRHTAVVMLTGRDSPLDRIRGKMAGCDGYLTKPVEEEKLLEAFSRFLSAHEHTAAI